VFGPGRLSGQAEMWLIVSPNAYKCSASEIMALSGRNIGNLVFRHAIFSLIGNANDYKSISYEQIDELSDSSNHVIVSCANWLFGVKAA
jgi:hypothetical protein